MILFYASEMSCHACFPVKWFNAPFPCTVLSLCHVFCNLSFSMKHRFTFGGNLYNGREAMLHICCTVHDVFALFLCQHLKRHVEEMHNRMEMSKKCKEVAEDSYENSLNKVSSFSKISLMLGYIMCLQCLV